MALARSSSTAGAVGSPSGGLGLNKVSRVIAVNLDRERKFAEAFRYFDEDDDGFINIDSLAQLLRCFGRGVTSEELDLLRICLVPDRITLRDFLNVLASNFASSFHMPKTLITDAFKLHNAAHSGKKSQTVMGHLEVDDGDLVSRQTWRELSQAFATPVTGATQNERQNMESYLAKVQVCGCVGFLLFVFGMPACVRACARVVGVCGVFLCCVAAPAESHWLSRFIASPDECLFFFGARARACACVCLCVCVFHLAVPPASNVGAHPDRRNKVCGAKPCRLQAVVPEH